MAHERTPARGASGRRSVLVIGVGNALRSDDAVGLELARALSVPARRAGIAVVEHEGEPLALIELWRGHEAVVILDALRRGAGAGTVHRLDASCRPLPAGLGSSASTHAVGVGEAIELARALGRLPRRVLVFGIEGRRYESGSELSPEVRTAVDGLAAEVLGVALELAGETAGECEAPEIRGASDSPQGVESSHG